jgi:hypothetical protein
MLHKEVKGDRGKLEREKAAEVTRPVTSEKDSSTSVSSSLFMA